MDRIANSIICEIEENGIGSELAKKMGKAGIAHSVDEVRFAVHYCV